MMLSIVKVKDTFEDIHHVIDEQGRVVYTGAFNDCSQFIDYVVTNLNNKYKEGWDL